MKRLSSLLLAGMLLLTSACGARPPVESQGGSPESAPVQTVSAATSGVVEELRIGTTAAIDGTNVMTENGIFGKLNYNAVVTAPFVVTDENGEVQPFFMTNWTISEDGKIYTFKIRDGVTFSDGTVCDANAILANFNAVIENKDRHTWLEMMNLLVGVSAPDDHTFVIELSEAYYPMLTELGCIRPFAMISPNCMINGSTKDGVSGYIGTGPYVLTDFETDQYAVFERNENYWGEKPEIERITVKVIPDNQTRIMALESGEIDLIFGKNMLDADAISQYVDSDKFEVALSNLMIFLYRTSTKTTRMSSKWFLPQSKNCINRHKITSSS